jgi:hypothetical protein
LCRYRRRGGPGGAATPRGPDHGRKELTVAEISLARVLVACPRHKQDGCLRCDASGFRQPKRCGGCGEPTGGISGRADATLARRGEDGKHYQASYVPPHREHRCSSDGREDGDVMNTPSYEERECWRCDRGRVYQSPSLLDSPHAGRWVPCPSCEGTRKAVVFVYPKKHGGRR